jgi:hypothetical protein
MGTLTISAHAKIRARERGIQLDWLPQWDDDGIVYFSNDKETRKVVYSPELQNFFALIISKDLTLVTVLPLTHRFKEVAPTFLEEARRKALNESFVNHIYVPPEKKAIVEDTPKVGELKEEVIQPAIVAPPVPPKPKKKRKRGKRTKVAKPKKLTSFYVVRGFCKNKWREITRCPTSISDNEFKEILSKNVHQWMGKCDGLRLYKDGKQSKDFKEIDVFKLVYSLDKKDDQYIVVPFELRETIGEHIFKIYTERGIKRFRLFRKGTEYHQNEIKRYLLEFLNAKQDVPETKFGKISNYKPISYEI